ncbi:MAG TPA: ASCH domain-containing protein [Candidatus Nitrosocosmicus sp.]|nr:ASCH domain-containing protein [Candidatus Nitrosocosmicus sp.]
MKQPYADLLATGRKTIEIRKWNTNFRGPFLIHASKNIIKDACLNLGIDENNLVKGAIIGKAFLYKVMRYSTKEAFSDDHQKHFSIEDIKSNHSFKRYGFLVKDAIKFKEGIPYLGKLGFFEVTDLSI